MKALAALLRRAVLHLLRNADPIVGALLMNELDQGVVLFRDPRSTAMVWCHGHVQYETVLYILLDI